MRTVKEINKPIRLFGLGPLQFMLFGLGNMLIIIICIFLRVHPILIVVIIGGILALSGKLLVNFRREYKAGNPDYVASRRVKSSTPKKIVDKSRIFNILILSEK